MERTICSLTEWTLKAGRPARVVGAIGGTGSKGGPLAKEKEKKRKDYANKVTPVCVN